MFKALLISGLLSASIVLAGCQMGSKPDAVTVSPDVTAMNQAASEGAAWEIAKSTKDADALGAFLSKYPDSVHTATAKLRLSLIQKGAIN